MANRLANLYFKDVKINNVIVSGIIDTGSECSLIKTSVAWSLDLHITKGEPRFLRAFSGQIHEARNVCVCELFIDSVRAITGLVVVPDAICPADVLVGNNFLSQPHVVFYKNGSDIKFSTFSECSFINAGKTLSPLTGSMINGAQNDKPLILELLNKYRKCVATSLSEIGRTRSVEMAIQLTTSNPVSYNPYRLSESHKQKLKDIIGELLENNIIRESTSPYASPIILVPKPNGELRLCVDYRKINSITVKQKWPIPLIDEQIDKLANFKYFTLIDLFSGYYQIPMAGDSVAKTAFITPEGHYEYLRMSFGLCNAPFVFQRLMNTIVNELAPGTAFPYLDDILIPSKTYEEGLLKLENVLKALMKHGLTLQPTKCQFLLTKINYLGREISEDGVRPNKLKIQAIIKLKPPINKKELRQFCGLSNYFRKFIFNYAFIMQPLTKLLKKNAIWSWSSEQNEAFELIKSILADHPVLKIFDPHRPIELHCDASSIGVAGVLMQKYTDKWHPVAFFSKQCTYEQSRYHSYELETMAVVFSLRHFRTYLLGSHFKIFTDCAAVRASALKKDLIPRIARWWLEIQDFTFDIEYRPGIKMGHVDYLSRHPIPDGHLISNIINLTESEWITAVQIQDEKLENIIKILQSEKNANNKNYFDNYVFKNNILYRKINNNLKWVVPVSCRWLICRLNHDDAGHFGFAKTLERIRKNYWFSKMRHFVKKYVAACLNCLYMKDIPGSKPGFLHPIPKDPIPFTTIHIDHLGPFVMSKRKNTHIFVLVDAFSKFIFLEPVRNTSVKYVISALKNFIFLFGPPSRLISDRGSAFTSKQMQDFCSEFGIKHIKNAVATPRANGQCERYNLTILNSLRCYSANDNNENNWDSHLKLIQFSINSTQNSTTQKTAYEVIMGLNPRPLADAKILAIIKDVLPRENLSTLRAEVTNKIKNKQIEAKYRFDKKRRPPATFKENDLVMVRKTDTGSTVGPKKLLPKFKGPFRVIKCLENDRYVVRDLRGSRKSISIVAIDSIKPWIVLNDQASQPM